MKGKKYFFVGYLTTFLVSRPYCVRMKQDELERIWKEAVTLQSKYCSGICLELTEEIHEEPQNSRCPGRDSNRAPTKYKKKALSLDQPGWWKDNIKMDLK
jgi:hypothetical protein